LRELWECRATQSWQRMNRWRRMDCLSRVSGLARGYRRNAKFWRSSPFLAPRAASSFCERLAFLSSRAIFATPTATRSTCTGSESRTLHQVELRDAHMGTSEISFTSLRSKKHIVGGIRDADFLTRMLSVAAGSRGFSSFGVESLDRCHP
jgi:hypothetical protein